MVINSAAGLERLKYQMKNMGRGDDVISRPERFESFTPKIEAVSSVFLVHDPSGRFELVR